MDRHRPCGCGRNAPDKVLQSAFQLDPLSVVAEEPTVLARNIFVAEPMTRQQSNVPAVTSVIDNLPGNLRCRKGTRTPFGDWPSSVVMRGLQTTISDAQTGTTIDGFLAGTSDCWSGAKANGLSTP